MRYKSCERFNEQYQSIIGREKIKQILVCSRKAKKGKTTRKILEVAHLISYTDVESFPVSRAMLVPRERNGIRTFWFSTNISSNKVRAFREDQKASICFVDRRFFRGVSLFGTMEVLESAEEKARIWREGDEMYYHGCVTAPDYCVLRFTAVKGRYYSARFSLYVSSGGNKERPAGYQNPVGRFAADFSQKAFSS